MFFGVVGVKVREIASVVSDHLIATSAFCIESLGHSVVANSSVSSLFEEVNVASVSLGDELGSFESVSFEGCDHLIAANLSVGLGCLWESWKELGRS